MLDAADVFEVVAEAATGAEAARAAGRLRPDVVLTDLRTPDLDGVTATAEIRWHYPEVHVVVVTSYDTDADAAIDAGAIGYLLKDTRRADLHPAVHAGARGQDLAGAAGRIAGSGSGVPLRPDRADPP